MVDPERETMVYHIAANRFLRGMVRLIVGMCVEVGLGKLSVEEVVGAMQSKERIRRNVSVPPEGLFLTEVRYPYSFKPLSGD